MFSSYLPTVIVDDMYESISPHKSAIWEVILFDFRKGASEVSRIVLLDGQGLQTASENFASESA